MLRILMTCLVAFLLSSVSANAEPRIFQGQAFVIGVTPACQPNFGVGSFFTVVYRQKMVPADVPEVISLVTDRSAFRQQSTDSTGTINGPVTTVGGVIGATGGGASGVPGSTNLTFTSMGGADLTVANGIKVVGAVNDAFGLVGCTLSIRGGVTLRPD